MKDFMVRLAVATELLHRDLGGRFRASAACKVRENCWRLEK